VIRRKIGFFLLCCFLIGSGPVAAADKLTLRCADVHSFGYPTVEGVLYLAKLVKERSGGRIQIVVYPQGQLGSEQAVVEMLKTGALEMGRVSVTQAAEIQPELGVFLMPNLFRDDDHKWRVLDGEIGQRILKNMSKAGMMGVGFQEAGTRSFYNSKRPIYKPSDLKGLKLRVQPSQVMVDMVHFLGASPVPIDYGGVYSALRAGAVDGAENNLPSYLTAKHYQVARYYSFDRHNSIPEIILVSQKIWEKISPSERAILLEAGRESARYQRGLWAKYEADCLHKLQVAGCRFNEVNSVAFEEVYLIFHNKYQQRFGALIDEIRSIQ
jgi:tripartite ATP-independent transporter DctP family solute receptor